MTKVSIIVPIYNVEKYLAQCIESILIQSFKDFELLLINDGSNDSCEQICENFRLHDPRVKVFNKANGGLVSACKVGINNASSEFICFIDSDDWIKEDYLEILMRNQLIHGADIICCQAIKKFPKFEYNYSLTTLKSGIYKSEEIISKLINDGEIGSKLISNSRCGKLIKTKIVKNNLIFYNNEIIHGEDQQLIVPTLLDCENISIIDNYFGYYYRYNEESITGRYSSNLWDKLLNLNIAIEQILLKKSKYNFKIQLNNELVSFAIHSIFNEYNCKSNFLKRYLEIKKITNNKKLIIAIKNSNIVKISLHKKLLSLLILHKLPFLITILEDINQIRKRGFSNDKNS